MEYYGNNDFRVYLSHHGILGQKWGIRRFQAYGSGGYDRKDGKTGKIVGEAKSKQQKLYKDVMLFAETYPQDGKGNGRLLSLHQREIAKIPEVKKAFDDLSSAREKVKEASKLAEEFNSLPQKEQDKYIRMASDQTWKTYGDPNDPNDRERWFELYKYDDLDQGDGNSFSYFCKERGTTYDDELEKHITANKEYEKACKDVARKLLGEYADAPVTFYNRGLDGKRIIETASDAVETALDNLSFDDQFERKYFIPG